MGKRRDRRIEARRSRYHYCSYVNCPDTGLTHEEAWARTKAELEKKKKEDVEKT